MNTTTSDTAEPWTTVLLELHHTRQRRRHTSTTKKTWELSHVMSPMTFQHIWYRHNADLLDFLKNQGYDSVTAIKSGIKLSMTSPDITTDIATRFIDTLIAFVFDYDVVPIVLGEDIYEVQSDSRDKLRAIAESSNVTLYWAAEKCSIFLVGKKAMLRRCHSDFCKIITKDNSLKICPIGASELEQDPNKTPLDSKVNPERSQTAQDQVQELEKLHAVFVSEKNSLKEKINRIQQDFTNKTRELQDENGRLRTLVKELQSKNQVQKDLEEQRKQCCELKEKIRVLETELQGYKNVSKAEPMQDANGACEQPCIVCLDDITDPKTLKCGHQFCRECIMMSFKIKKACPICGDQQRIVTGDQPVGKMTARTVNESVSGHEGTGSILITYSFPGGQQGEDHPEPGKPYTGLMETCYLPDIQQGRLVCKLLKIAFDRKLVFTIGASDDSTTDEDVITWNNITHKTSRDGGPDRNGFPDPKYMDTVISELRSKGVTEDDIDQE